MQQTNSLISRACALASEEAKVKFGEEEKLPEEMREMEGDKVRGKEEERNGEEQEKGSKVKRERRKAGKKAKSERKNSNQEKEERGEQNEEGKKEKRTKRKEEKESEEKPTENDTKRPKKSKGEKEKEEVINADDNERETLTLRPPAPTDRVIFMLRERWEVSSFIFLGVTLWTDLPPPRSDERESTKKAKAKAKAKEEEEEDDPTKYMTDFKKIRVCDGEMLSLSSYSALHNADTEWLSREIQKAERDSPSKYIVVLSHHPPISFGVTDPSSPHTTSPFGLSSPLHLNPDLFRSQVILWCHGHTHYSNDLIIPLKKEGSMVLSASDPICGAVRVVSNQLGYPRESPSHTRFSPSLSLPLSFGGISIWVAAYCGDAARIDAMISQFPSEINFRWHKEQTPLIAACSLGQSAPTVLRILQSEGVDLSAKDADGKCALTYVREIIHRKKNSKFGKEILEALRERGVSMEDAASTTSQCRVM